MSAVNNEEMLLEMSNILQVQLHPIKEQLDRVEDHVGNLEHAVKALDVRVGNLEQSVKVLDARVGNLEQSVKVLETDVKKLKQSMKVLETDVGKLKLSSENYILPTLGELKACYTGTYERYCKWADCMEGMSQDVDILKRVVATHSRKLERLS